MIRVVIATCLIANAWPVAAVPPSALEIVQVYPLPQNPCDLLTPQQVSVATGLVVIEMRRVPGIQEIMAARKQGLDPGPGNICSYHTGSEFGEINIAIPPQAEQNVDHYLETRDRYFRTFHGSAQAISGLGKDAWISGGTSLHLLVRDDVYIVITTQMYQRRSREIAINVAREILKQFSATR